MALSKKLKEWQQENIIDNTTADRINQYEQQQSKPLVLWAFGGLGAFTIIVGLISVIAANWLHTPDWVKLGADLIVCLIIAIALFRTIDPHNNDTEKQWLREVLVILYYGFILASMALIGQTYQLGGSVAKLFLVWTLATLPLILLGRGKFLAVLWLLGSATTYFLNVDALQSLIATWMGSEYTASVVLGSLCLLGPLFFMLVSRVPWLLRERPVFADEISRFSWLAIIISGWLCQFLWYEALTFGHGSEFIEVIAICFVAVAAMVYFIPQLYAEKSPETHLAMRVILSTVFTLGATAVWHFGYLDLVGALTNLAYLCVLAWAALKIKSTALFNMLTAFICLRIIIIYFEVFGGMFETGIGLMIGGVLTLLITWWWLKKSNTLAQRLGVMGDS